MQRTIQYIKSELSPYYPITEVEGLTRIIFEFVLNFSYTDIILSKNNIIDKQHFEAITKITKRLQNQEPIQYILGETEFYNLKIKVNSSVLIPRPETEELVQWIIETCTHAKSHILDIGTGSGCIALALKKQFSNASVKAVDVSSKSLNVAKKNAAMHNLTINFMLADILNWEKYNWGKYNIIVSNPPYVRNAEKEQMSNNVLDYEPPRALFVEDSKPLIFYHEISTFAQKNLLNGGWLFFEINEYLRKEMQELVKRLGFKKIELRKDLNGKYRMLKCQK